MACTLPILILAAGRSARMRGTDKLMETVEGRPLLRRQIDIACSATSGHVLVTLPSAPHPRYGTLDGTTAKPIAVPDAADGMSVSLRRGLSALPPDAPAVMILLADLPALTAEDLRQVAAAAKSDTETLIWRGATDAGAPGHPIVFDRSLFSALQRLQGDTGGAHIVAEHSNRMKLVPLPGDRARLDLDTPEAWAAWRANQP